MYTFILGLFNHYFPALAHKQICHLSKILSKSQINLPFFSYSIKWHHIQVIYEVPGTTFLLTLAILTAFKCNFTGFQYEPVKLT